MTTSRQHWNNLFHQVSNLKQRTSGSSSSSLAFSNPTYDQFESNLDSVQELEEEEDLNLQSNNTEEIVVEEYTTVIVEKPVPKPRKCRTSQKQSIGVASESPEVTQDSSTTIVANNNQNSANLLTILNQKTSDSIRMTQLLDEIDSLANLFDQKLESLNNSDSLTNQRAKKDLENFANMVNESELDQNDQDNQEQQELHTDTENHQKSPQPLRRKRVPVSSGLLKFSLSNMSSTGTIADEEDGSEKTTSADSGVFNLETALANMITKQNHEESAPSIKPEDETKNTAKPADQSISTNDEPTNNDSKTAEPVLAKKPPKLPPRKPSKFDLLEKTTNSGSSNQQSDQPSAMPTKTNQNVVAASNIKWNCRMEMLSMDHLHLKNLALQRCGYLWKTGPNYRSFKSRWSILYRHNFDLADANFSYYFNRSGMSASLSGKIMLSDIEFVATIDTIPSKTRLPKLNSDSTTCCDPSNSRPNSSVAESTSSGGGFSYFKIGVQGRQGRVYLMAARSQMDLQLWLHAFVQTISLHAFKNKELYHFGFLRVRFTITGKWQTCFGLLTTDRLFYIFEMMADQETNRTIDCKAYHVFNLRKTVQVNRFDDCSENPYKNSNSSGTEQTGFSLTQNGGRVVYIVGNFESHIHICYVEGRVEVKDYSNEKKKNLSKKEIEQMMKESIVDKLEDIEEVDISNFNTKNGIEILKQLVRNMEKCQKQRNHLAVQTGEVLNKLKLQYGSLANLIEKFEDVPELKILSQSYSYFLISYSDSCKEYPQFEKCNLSLHFIKRYQSIMKFWQTPDQPEKVLFSEQYLTKENVPVAIDRCLKFLSTFNQKMDLFSESEYGQSATQLDLNGLANCSELLSELRHNSWNVHLLPQKHNSAQIGLLLLHYLRSMNQCIFTDQLLTEWLQVSDDVNFEQKRNNLKRLLKALPPVNYATLRKIIIYLASLTTQYSLASSLCKSLVFTKQKCTMTIPISSARKLVTTLLKDYLWLFEVTKEEVDKEMHIKRMTHLIINQNAEDSLACKSIGRQSSLVQNFDGGYVGDGGRNRSFSVASHMSTVSSASSSIIDTRNVSILIIGIKVIHPNLTKTVNVHLNTETTVDQVLEMVLEKISPDNGDTKQYSLFEVLCYRRLERILSGKERVLPIVLAWSNWPSHWSADASLEVKVSDYLLKICLSSLEKSCGKSNSSSSSGGSNIPSKNDSVNFQPMLMSVIRYCGQSDTRLIKKILVEFSGSTLFLYCKESHVLIGQYNINDIYWYLGVESATIVHSKHPITPVEELISSPKLTNNQTTTTTTTTSKSIKRQNSLEVAGIPALTFVEKNSINVRQGKERLNFGQTLVFSNWNEMYQWIRALLVEANR